MRAAFFHALDELAEKDSRIHLITGDLGFGVVEAFAAKFPKQFVNVGVAEQNMTGIAAGLALCGKIVFVYSIGNFPTLRCLEQIRNDICYHDANVKIVAVGGGLSYGALGMSHHATEDLAIMRALPQMTVIAPGDPVETGLAARALAAYRGPAYLRLGRAGDPLVHQRRPDFQVGTALIVRDGRDMTVFSTGGMLATALQVAERLDEAGLSTRVVSMHTLKPLDCQAVLAAAQETGALVTLEEHSVIGGLGSAVAEVLAESTVPKVPFKRFGLPPRFSSETGSQEYLRQRQGLSSEGLLRSLEPFLQTTFPDLNVAV
jgi:transketolase